MKTKSKIVYYLIFFALLLSCKTEKSSLSTTSGKDSKASVPESSFLICPESKLKKTHLVEIRGMFTTKAQTIVPAGEKPFPIELNKEDLDKLNLGTQKSLCRVLERRGIGAGKKQEIERSDLTKMTIDLGPGLKLKNEKMEFHIPPADKSPELLMNFEHSLDRLLDGQK